MLGARIGFRACWRLGAALITASFLINTFAHAHPWELVIGGILLGAGITFAFAAMANLIVDAVPQSEVGIATGINTVMRTVGGSFGAAIATAILAGRAPAPAASRPRAPTPPRSRSPPSPASPLWARPCSSRAPPRSARAPNHALPP